MAAFVRQGCVLAVVAALWAMGCGGGNTVVTPMDDAGAEQDTGSPADTGPTDTGPGPVDAGTDTGTDTGTPPPDAGHDAGEDVVVPVDNGPPDAGTPDAGCGELCPPDAGFDAGSPDAGSPDVGFPDVGFPDVGSPDVGSPDVGVPDVGVPDTGVVTPRRLGTTLEITAGGGNAASSGYRLSASVQYGVAAGGVGRAAGRHLLTGTVARP